MAESGLLIINTHKFILSGSNVYKKKKKNYNVDSNMVKFSFNESYHRQMLTVKTYCIYLQSVAVIQTG